MTGLIGLANYTLSLMHMHENARDVGKFGRKMPTLLAFFVRMYKHEPQICGRIRAHETVF